MNKTKTTWLIVIIVILSATVLTLLGVYVIYPAIMNNLNEQPTPNAGLIITPGSNDVGGGDRAIEVKVDAWGGPLSISGVSVVGLIGVQILDTPTGSSLIGTVIYESGSDMVYIVGAFSVGTSYDITIHFVNLDKSFSHTA